MSSTSPLHRLCLFVMIFFCLHVTPSVAFAPAPLHTHTMSSAHTKRAAVMKREVIPQIIFAAGCAGAVFTYVFTHIDEIREKQKVAVERTMTQQADSIRRTQDAQKEAIDRALKQQEDAVRRIKEDAAKRK